MGKEGKYVELALEELCDEELKQLKEEIGQIDLRQVNKMYQQCCASNTPSTEESSFEPLNTIMKADTSKQQQKWEQMGIQQIADGKVAVVLLAGGQGTRLQYAHPKGMFDFGLPSGKSLFQIQAERILNLQQRAGKVSGGAAIIPWYIMTSEVTYDETLDFFTTNDFFGLDPKDVAFFNQGKFPATDEEGNLLLASPSSLYRAPNGNGGVYEALLSSKNIEDMEKRGIETIFIYGVDNALVRVADPVFVGSFLESGTSCGSKSVPKSCPEERVGILCKKNGIVQVIEYSEISNEMANQRNDDGTLTYNTGNIVTHIFTFSCLKDVCERAEEMPYHLAKKEITIYNPESKTYEKTWAYKYEQFVFDAFQLVSDVFALEVVRSEEFTAIKNKEGNDSPQTALQDVSSFHRSLLEKAGAIISGDGLVEISPLVSYAGEALEFVDKKRYSTPIVIQNS